MARRRWSVGVGVCEGMLAMCAENVDRKTIERRVARLLVGVGVGARASGCMRMETTEDYSICRVTGCAQAFSDFSGRVSDVQCNEWFLEASGRMRSRKQASIAGQAVCERVEVWVR